MFRDDAQASRIIRVLLATVALEDLWSEMGPTQRARSHRNQRTLPLRQRVMLRVAWDLWATWKPGIGGTNLKQVLLQAPKPALRMLGELFVALSVEAPPERKQEVESWIERWLSRPVDPSADAGDDEGSPAKAGVGDSA